MAALIKLFAARDFGIHFASAAAESLHRDNDLLLACTLHTISLNDASFDTFIAKLNPAIVIFDRFMTEEQFSARVKQHCPDALHMLNTEDLHSLRHARHEAVKQGGPPNDAKLNNAFSQREIAAILRSDISLIISSAEYRLLTDYYRVPDKQLQLFPLQQPLTSPPELPDYPTRQHFITVGNFRHAPNWDAVLQLKQLWPAIRARLPDAELHIYGAYPPKKATQLHNAKQGFVVKGWVNDIGKAMASARVCLAPLRFGAGIKGKLLTAMQYATPSVTTEVGAEGIASAGEWPGKVVSLTPPAAYIDAACQLYREEAQWQQASQQAKTITAAYQNAQHQAQAALFEKIAVARNDLPAFRQSLFLHSLIWHHSLRASQFMSQWIEAKNR
ncbi:glycosyltransferase [Alteromonas alba]|uniref:Glycosyltransferase n=2 Tax=Alteromonas alba TaxID=2079529 RepID=A0A2S9V706_9ALTE|nr:glycosyltransferase [Alteromonas alba]